MKSVCTQETPLGPITLRADEGALTALQFGAFAPKETDDPTPLMELAFAQLMEYLHGTRTDFILPLAPDGTAFQREVWDALKTIPYGQTVCYRQIAEQIGRPLAARAVGMANHRNPLPILIPCHRVIGQNGALVGYGGGLPIKERLLALEREHRKE